LIIFMIGDLSLEMAGYLAGLATLPLDLHGTPDAQRKYCDEGVTEICFYPDEGDPVGIEAVADGCCDLFWVLNQAPEKGMRSDRVEFGARLRMGVYTIAITTAE
jgi:hypothetical protein